MGTAAEAMAAAATAAAAWAVEEMGVAPGEAERVAEVEEATAREELVRMRTVASTFAEEKAALETRLQEKEQRRTSLLGKMSLGGFPQRSRTERRE